MWLHDFTIAIKKIKKKIRNTDPSVSNIYGNYIGNRGKYQTFYFVVVVYFENIST